MNKEMVWGTVRHFITLISAAILAGKTDSIETAVVDLVQKISSGDISSVTGASLIVFSLLWSVWSKASSDTKKNMINALSFKR